MKINKNSWHYKALNRVDLSPPRTLCGYFWKLVLACCLHVFMGVLMIAYLLCLPLIALVAFMGGMKPNSWKAVEWNEYKRIKVTKNVALYPAHVIFPALVLATVFIAVVMNNPLLFMALVAPAMLFFVWVKDNPYVKQSQETSENEPLTATGVVFAFIKAKKRKVCPLIEYVD